MNDYNYEKILTQTYLKFLKRKPDKEGLNHYVRQLKNNIISVDDLEKIFKNSDEFKFLNSEQIDKKITKLFSSDEAKNFFFFQFNSGNAKYFFKNNKTMSVRISEIPHYSLVKNSISGTKEDKYDSKNKYLEYLRNSWPSYDLDISEDKLNSKLQNFLEYIDKIQKKGKLSEPVLLTQLPNIEGYFVVDGNHRCSIASALGLKIHAQIMDFSSVFDHFMQVDEFYGTKNKNMPYQNIYINKNIVREGRRNDVYERLKCLPKDFLKNKTVLDVACNFGMNSIASFQFGAKKVLGIEISKKMINFATRFAIFNNCYSYVEFEQFDLDEDCLPSDNVYDVGFMLSIHHHLKKPSSLVNIVQKNIKEAVIFEGHPGTTLNDYQIFLDNVKFSKIVKIGELDMSIFDKEPKRPLWIFYK